eukprot:5180289-Ditylum_brightwellii.AAC.1
MGLEILPSRPSKIQGTQQVVGTHCSSDHTMDQCDQRKIGLRRMLTIYNIQFNLKGMAGKF